MVPERARHVVYGSDGPIRLWAAAPFTTTTRAVCHDCNTGWMSQLESKVKPILTPIILGRDYVLSPDDQTLVAAWCLKTSAMLDRSIGGSATVIVPHLQYLMLGWTPPPVVRVVLATYAASLWVARFRSAGTAQVNARTPEGGVEQGTFQVSGHTLQRHLIDIGTPTLDPYLLNIWPRASGSVTGPPPALPQQGFQILANAFRGDSGGSLG
jgi:hypothetical protein